MFFRGRLRCVQTDYRIFPNYDAKGSESPHPRGQNDNGNPFITDELCAGFD
jgi:hypothetical protein